jgi:mono/diheme cytochrome c family protein
MRTWLIAASALLFAQGASAAEPQRPADPFPAGEGREIVAVACTQCHPASAITQLRVGADAWRFQIYDMILRGAQVQTNEIDSAVSYLATHFGPGINVPPGRPVSLPDGAGKDLVEAQCSVCHGLDRVALSQRSPAEWDKIVRRMTFLGATASGDDTRAMVAYLNDKFGRK